MNIIDKSIRVLDFIRDNAEPGQISTYDNGQEKICVQNVERLYGFTDANGKPKIFRELGRMSGVIRGKKQ